MMHRRLYSLHGFIIQVDAQSESWANSIQEILGAYLVEDPGHEKVSISARLGSTHEAFHPPAGCDECCHFEDLRFLRQGDATEIWIDVHGKGWVRLDTAANLIEGALDLDPEKDAWVVAHHAFYPALLELLKFQGLFPLHAGLVEKDGQGLLICGASGSGKTTLTLALAESGWSLLGDDTCFLHLKDSQVEALAFWEDLHVTEETMQRFPRLAFLKNQPLRRANWKRHFSVHDLDTLDLSPHCIPRWLIFPKIAGDGPTSLKTIGAIDALTRVTSQSLVPVRKEIIQQHLDTLGQLIRQVDRIEVEMGPDLDEVLEKICPAIN